MKKQVGFLREMFQQVFSGFAHEHSGEMLSLSGKHHILSNDLTSVTVKDKQAKPLKSISFSNRILLAFEKDIDDELIRYSIGAAKHFNARIDILTSMSKNEIVRFMDKELLKQTVPWSYIQLETELLEGIANYTSRHSNVVFMVTGQHQVLTEHYTKTKHAA